MITEATILGSGSSGGVPRLGVPGGDWGACDRHNPRNRRMRASLLLRCYKDKENDPDAITSVLIDTSPDLRAQLLLAGCADLDAVFYTHHHADQAHGIDDLRPLAIRRKKPLDCYIHDPTSRKVRESFAYCFQGNEKQYYPAILKERSIALEKHETICVEGAGGVIRIRPVLVRHGSIDALGFLCNEAAMYTPDISAIYPDYASCFTNLSLWICDCLQYKPHPSHAHYARIEAWDARFSPRKMILTNLHCTLDYATLAEATPAHITPAYDLMTVTIDS